MPTAQPIHYKATARRCLYFCESCEAQDLEVLELGVSDVQDPAIIVSRSYVEEPATCDICGTVNEAQEAQDAAVAAVPLKPFNVGIDFTADGTDPLDAVRHFLNVLKEDGSLFVYEVTDSLGRTYHVDLEHGSVSEIQP